MKITYQGRNYSREEDQSVLDCLLSNGITVPYSCKSGVCCSCMMKSNSQSIPTKAQNGLKDTLKDQGYFLACVCKPDGDIEICDAEPSVEMLTTVTHLDLLNDEVIRIYLKSPEDFEFKAGQYLTLVRNDGVMRSYSIASLPETGLLELHVRIIPNGKMSQWIRNSLMVGDKVFIRGPYGNCFYSSLSKDRPLLFAGTGTGLAPLYGIVKDALQQGHTGPIVLFHGGVNPFSLYLTEELSALAKQHPQFQYRPCVLSNGTDVIPEIAIDQAILKNFPDLKTARIYLCGDPQLVNNLRKKLFISGASSKEIYADAFLPSIA